MNEMTLNISDFPDARSFVQAALRLGRASSMRAWAKRLGYRNPSLISDVLSGRRKPSRDLLLRISAKLDLSKVDEGKLLRLAEKAKSSATNPSDMVDNVIAVDQFRIVADWFHLAILDLMDLASFQFNAGWIQKKLAFKLSVKQVEEALSRLKRVGLIEAALAGKTWKKKSTENYFVGRGQSNSSIQLYHSQSLDLAMRSLLEHDVESRDFSSSNLVISKENLQTLRNEIYRFHRKILKLAAKPGEGDELYRMNLQLFRLDRDFNVLE